MSSWYISTTGSDTTGDGSLGNPYATAEKCLTVSSNGDTIKYLNGTYAISSIVNVTKQVTVTSNSGIKADVILNASTTIFNVQESNVIISNMTLQTSNGLPLVTVDRMSTGTTVPTFWSGISITGNNLKYVNNCLTLNGTFSVTSNTLTRQSGTTIATLLNVYSTRGTCTISSNTVTDSQPISKVINVSSTGSGSYLDRCNSKGGTLTIGSNTITLTHASQLTYIYYQDYFNQYSYGTIGSDSQYNINTKLSFVVSSNTVSTTALSIFSNIKIIVATDYNMFNNCQINGNSVNNTKYGVLHLDKNIDSTTVTIDTSIPRFKIYSNTLDTAAVTGIQFDASDITTMFTDLAGTIPAVNLNDPVRLLKSTNNGKELTTTLVNNSSPPFLTTFTTGTKCIKFNNNTAYYSFSDTSFLTGVTNATMIIVSYCPSTFTSGGCGHLFNMGYGWYPFNSTIYETFYCGNSSNQGRTSYASTANSFSNTLIYGVVANSSTGRTKCYSLNVSLSTLNTLADLNYDSGTSVNPINGVYTIGSQQTNPFNRAGLAELLILPTALSESELLNKMMQLKTKWNI